jgi:hypothetical protein
MGLCVALQSESGEQLEMISDEKNLLARLVGNPDWKECPMLASIDRYGDTTFNSVQIEHFLIEWESLFVRAATSEEKSLLQSIKDLAERTLLNVHQYLVFIGD